MTRWSSVGERLDQQQRQGRVEVREPADRVSLNEDLDRVWPWDRGAMPRAGMPAGGISGNQSLLMRNRSGINKR